MTPQVPSGYVARFSHTRWYQRGNRRVEAAPKSARVRELLFDGYGLLSKGGSTTVRLYKEEDLDEVAVTYTAKCYAYDQFNKKVGRAVALGRAIKILAQLQSLEPMEVSTLRPTDSVEPGVEPARAGVCSYCGHRRSLYWTGRRYLCEDCYGQHLGERVREKDRGFLDALARGTT